MRRDSGSELTPILLGVVIGILGTLGFQEIKSQLMYRNIIEGINAAANTLKPYTPSVSYANAYQAAKPIESRPIQIIQQPPVSNWNFVKIGDKACWYRTVGKSLEKKCENDPQ